MRSLLTLPLHRFLFSRNFCSTGYSLSLGQVIKVFESSPVELNNDEKLEFYGLFKTATVGAAEGNQPSKFNFVKRAKWDAWNDAATTLDPQQATERYTTRACELMGMSLAELNSASAVVPDCEDSDIVDENSASAAPAPETETHFRHRDIREICGIALAEDTTSRLEARSSGYTCVTVTLEKTTGVAIVNLSRPSKMNAMNIPLWEELLDVFQECSTDPQVKCVVLGADGDHFCSGMDLGVFGSMSEIHDEETCPGRQREQLSNLIQYFQDGCSAPEHCQVPVLAAIHGHAVGGAIDLITSCDMRYCVDDAMFCVKEIDLGIVADVGTTQRLPTIVGDQRARELTYTARPVYGKEAEKIGLVLDSFSTKDEMLEHVMDVARTIAAKSPLTIRGIKQVSLYNRDHPNVTEGLQHVKMWNTSYLFSEDLTEAATAMMTKRPPVYKKP